MGFRFKILSGRHEGAEIALAAQRYTLGCGENNSLILSDSVIAEQHLEFFFAQGELSILRASGKVKVQGKAVESFPVDVAPLQLVTLSSEKDVEDREAVHFTYGDESTRTWPSQERIAEILDSANKKPEAAADKAAKGKDKARNAHKSRSTFSRFKIAGGRRARLITRSVVITSSIAMVIAIVLFGHAFFFDPKYRTVKRMHAVERSLAMSLAKTPAENRTVRLEEFGKEGDHILIGYVATESDLADLRSLALEAGLRIDLVSLEGMHDAIDVIAQEHRVYARFALTPLKPRSIHPLEKQLFLLHAEGFVEVVPSFELFHTAILAELPQVTQIDLNLTTGKILTDEVEQVLTSNIAFAGVKTKLRNGDLVLTGAVFENFKETLTKSLDTHFQTLPRPPRIVDQLLVVPPFYAEITALLLGASQAVDIRLSRTQEVKRYLKGEKITDDINIEDIRSNGVTLRYRGQNLGLPLSLTSEAP